MIQVLSQPRPRNNPVLIGEPGVEQDGDRRRGLGQPDHRGRRARRGLEGASGSSRSTSAPWSPGPSTAASSRNGSRPSSRRSATARARSSPSSDELHTIVGAGAAEGAMDAGQMIKPMLAQGELRLIGATTLERVPQVRLRRTPRSSVASSSCSWASPRWRDTINASCAGLSERYMAHPARCGSRTLRAGGGGRCCRTATSPGASCPTRRSTLHIDEDGVEAAHRDRLHADRARPDSTRRIRQLEIEKLALEKGESDEALR